MNAHQLAAPPLAAIADIAARLASADGTVANLQGILSTVQALLGAEECAIWLDEGDSLSLASRAGVESISMEEIQQALDRSEREGERIIVRRLVSGNRSMGVLVVAPTAALPSEGDAFVDTLAALVSASLAQGEQVQQLRAELGARDAQIASQRKLTEHIIDALPLGLYVIDRDYRVQVWNRNRETGWQGISRDKALGRTIFEILHRRPAEGLKKEFDDVFRSGRIQQFNIEARANADGGSGRTRTFRITKVPMRLAGSEISHVISIGEDVTDWTTAQNRFSQAEKLAAIGQLAAGVMHEINNPLATIAACAESLGLRMDDLRAAGVDVPRQAGEYLALIDGEVQRCKGIADRLLSFARPQAVRREPVDINGVVDQTLFLLKHHARFKAVQLSTILDATLPTARGNSEQLIQVLMALLINAADAMGELGTITIRTRPGVAAGEKVVMEVIDEGPGISRADLPKIFEPFYTTKPAGRGTGLGLSICYGIVTEHGGRIEVDSAVGAGSTFRVLLPEAAA
ncbi:MAG: Adaptive-response sensory-kinase SasA [Gemmatimonadaceae bacterium]|nr:Adaptive-response sensory-kinase SasA [Gemmatimonadaceae bacterium]